MSRLSRFTQLIFGSNAGANQIEQFGSLANGTPVYTTNIATIQALANYLTGWFGGVVGSNAPAIEDLNALCYLFAYQLAYSFQAGIPEWDSGTTYYIGSIVSDGTNKVYVSLTNTNLNNLVTDTTNWKVIIANVFTTLGDLEYSAANGVPTRLPGNTTANIEFLSQTGTGSVSAAPVLKRITPTQTRLTTGSGTYTPPSGCTQIRVRMVGGGGGGGGATNCSATQASIASSGGGGAYIESLLTGLAGSYAYTVGAGGNAGAAGNNNGSNGTQSTFGTLVADCGLAGHGATAGTTQSLWQPGTGGIVGNCVGDIIIPGGNGSSGYVLVFGSNNIFLPSQGGSSFLGPINNVTQPQGGNVTAAYFALQYGGGGGGGASAGNGSSTSASQAGAAGANGIIIIDEFYT